MMNSWEQKLQKTYGNAVVNKAESVRYDDMKLPRFVTEYLLAEYCKQGYTTDNVKRLNEFLESNVPMPNTSNEWHYRLKEEGEVNLLSNFSVQVNVENTKGYILKIPAIKIDKGEISKTIINKHTRLLSPGGVWGMGKLKYTPSESSVQLVKFQPFQLTKINMDQYILKREEFSLEEWVDIIISTLGYNPDLETGITRNKKLIICRLLPIINERLYMMEFGAPGTGKTYIFDHLTSHAFVISGSQTTPAQLFYNLREKQDGLVRQYSCLLFDEIDKINDRDMKSDLVNKLLKLMESGSFDRGQVELPSNVSIMFSGNIKSRHQAFPVLSNNLCEKLKHQAFVDRISGIIPGWELPPLAQKKDSLTKRMGFAADYFSEVLENLRHISYMDVVQDVCKLSDNANNRDEKAVSKIVSGLVKLLLPHRKFTKDEIALCLDLAKELRQNVINELYEITHDRKDAREIEIKT